jgi:membrane-bound serine protease (ClpP class)
MCLVPALLLILLNTQPAQAQPAPVVIALTLDDTVQPISAQYLERGLDDAARRHAALVVLSLDTPGGLLTSTRAMVESIERSRVPVAVYVSPGGARAGSAGFFLLEAADIAAMAPSTNAGASHPIVEGVNSTGMDPILKQKIENDAAAFLRSYVSVRGRNTEAAEDAVRNSKSYSADECLKLNLIGFVAPSLAALIQELNGRTVKRFDGSTQKLALDHYTLVSIPPSLREQFLTRLTDPDLAVLLLLAGLLLIYAEFNVPGTIIPGALGTLLLLLGLFGLNLLPIRHTAVALLVAGLVLMVLELKSASHGILAMAGTVSIVFGLATLVDVSEGGPGVQPATAIAAGLAFGVISMSLAWLAIRARRNKTLLGPDALLGRLGVAMTDLRPSGEEPAGQVEVRGEIWQAALAGAPGVPRGTPVLVQRVDGLQLIVSPQTAAAIDPAAPTNLPAASIAAPSSPSNR